jgi:outer membrane porin, OprD family
MKRVALAIIVVVANLSAEENLHEALKASKVLLDARVFYFDRSFDKPNTPNATALTAGGIAKIETGEYYGLKLGVAQYGSYLVGLTDKKYGTGTSLLESGTNNNLSFIGEAYAKYSYGKTSLQVGKQRLSTPLANDHDLRLLPSTYQGAILRTDELADTMIEAGWLSRYSGFTSTYNTFKDMSAAWGNDGLAYGYIENKSIKDTKISVQYAKALKSDTVAVNDYRYASVRYSVTKESFIEGQYGANDYRIQKDSKMYGLTCGINPRFVDVAFVYNKIASNNFKAIESGIMYTDWQQGYGNYEPSEAYGGYMVFKLTEDATIKLGKVFVWAKENSVRDDFSETMLDAWYKFNSSNKLRIRYSIKDETNKASAYGLANNKAGYDDRVDFRVVYYYSFATL